MGHWIDRLHLENILTFRLNWPSSEEDIPSRRKKKKKKGKYIHTNEKSFLRGYFSSLDSYYNNFIYSSIFSQR